jgi:dipeptidyl aminopeptidase/acylaminoacyl peptidase
MKKTLIAHSILVGLAASFVCAAAEPDAAPPAILDFVRDAQFDKVDLSPDGKYLAAIVDLGENRILRFIDIAEKKDFSLRAANGVVADFDWVSDKRVVYSIGEKLGGIERPVLTGELVGVNADGGSHTYLYGYRGHESSDSHIKHDVKERGSAILIDTLVDDDKNVVIETALWDNGPDAYRDVWKLDVERGSKRQISRGPAPKAHMITDLKGDVRLAIAANKNGISNDLYERDPKSGEWHLLIDGSKKSFFLEPQGFAADNQHFYAQATTPKGPDGLLLFDAQKLDYELVSRHEWADPMQLQWSRFSPGKLIAVNYQPGEALVDAVAEKSVELQGLAGLMKSFPNEHVALVSSTRDGKKFLYLVWGDRREGDFFLYDAEAKSASQLASKRPWLKPEQLQPMKGVEIAARDGTTLHGYLTRGRGLAEGAKGPLVVFVHGGPFGIYDKFEYSGEVQLLASRGYSVLQVNYRGSGGYGQAFLSAGQKAWGGAMQDDLTDATKWAIEKGYADSDRVCIFGASYGGYASLMGAAREPDLYRCAIGYVGLYDLEMWFDRGDTHQSSFGLAYLRNAVGNDKNALRAASPARQAEKIKAKVMLIAGGTDQRTPAVQSEAMREALKKAGNEPEWLYKSTEGHGFVDDANRVELYTKVLQFLDKNIGAGAKKT